MSMPISSALVENTFQGIISEVTLAEVFTRFSCVASDRPRRLTGVVRIPGAYPPRALTSIYSTPAVGHVKQ